MWGFETIRANAIEMLETFHLGPLMKLQLSEKYEKDSWFFDALLELVMRNEPLGIDEARFLGLESTVKLAEIRDATIKDCLDSHPSNSREVYTQDAGWFVGTSTVEVSCECLSQCSPSSRLLANDKNTSKQGCLRCEPSKPHFGGEMLQSEIRSLGDRYSMCLLLSACC